MYPQKITPVYLMIEALEHRLCLSAPSRHHAAVAARSSHHKSVVAPARHSRSSRHHATTTTIDTNSPVLSPVLTTNGNGGSFAVGNNSFAAGGATGVTPLTTVGSPLTTNTIDPITGQITGVPSFSLNNGLNSGSLNSGSSFYVFDPVTGLPVRVNNPFASSNSDSTVNFNGGFSGQTPILGTDGSLLNNSDVITASGFTQNGVSVFNNQGGFATAGTTA
jgi:hypothetical protein